MANPLISYTFKNGQKFANWKASLNQDIVFNVVGNFSDEYSIFFYLCRTEERQTQFTSLCQKILDTRESLAIQWKRLRTWKETNSKMVSPTQCMLHDVSVYYGSWLIYY